MALSLPQTGAASRTSLAALVVRYGSLPTSYVEFLAVRDGVRPPENTLSGTNNAIGVRSFIPASEIIETASRVEGLCLQLIPIADDDAGNFFCIGIDDHKVYFWDHEVDSDKIIANDFEEFIRKLEPFDIDSVKLRPGQVQRIWVNRSFKPEF